jgi:hypothetical protein
MKGGVEMGRSLSLRNFITFHICFKSGMIFLLKMKDRTGFYDNSFIDVGFSRF